MCFSKVIKETRCRQLRSSVLWVDETEKRLQTNYRLLMSWRFRSLLRGMRLRVIPFNFMQHCCWFVGFGKLWLVYIVGRAMSSLPTPTVQVRLSNVSLFDGWSTSLIKGFSWANFHCLKKMCPWQFTLRPRDPKNPLAQSLWKHHKI